MVAAVGALDYILYWKEKNFQLDTIMQAYLMPLITVWNKKKYSLEISMLN